MRTDRQRGQTRNIKLQENQLLVIEVVECGRTDREKDKQKEANSRLLVFC
jgi:Zn ribbon nucleic-acid-binding protein